MRLIMRRSLLNCLHQPLPRASNSTLELRRYASRIRSAAHHPSKPPRNPLDPISFHRLEAEYRAYYLRRIYFAVGGMVSCIAITMAIVSTVDIEKMSEKNDVGPDSLLKDLERGTPVVKVLRSGMEMKDGSTVGRGTENPVELVPTESDVVPTFPKTIELRDDEENKTVDGKTEYQLMGLGIRTVSFLNIKVYVVGIYVATEDITALQQALIRRMDPIATTLIPPERERLQHLLLDPEQGERIWQEILGQQGLRTVVRIVPTRNTDWHHLRDGWIRGITAKAQSAARRGDGEFENEDFAAAVKDFRGMFSGGARKSVPKATAILLVRNRRGELNIWCGDDQRASPALERLGGVKDERISRLVWLNYLAGKTVASESARRNVVDGVMEFVQRPIGTVTAPVA